MSNKVICMDSPACIEVIISSEFSKLDDCLTHAGGKRRKDHLECKAETMKLQICKYIDLELEKYLKLREFDENDCYIRPVKR